MKPNDLHELSAQIATHVNHVNVKLTVTVINQSPSPVHPQFLSFKALADSPIGMNRGE